ncbi:hypothetical protein SAMD00019534_070860 [Acytostelium subglobosum LB1]|uniref:hypothetical protein n=1 Tax=Acytostelium subglobosum LB1 TaxID=1410327 RepID=UPI00064507B7|nr:hypothetical protein SAMD00019534_070860 [Acytostelium subglobosum LB1]GAM23911.1 hypothetical protein SAMD00019534_070860 [Acytostelium subglobosum LB1]|eukprot:XP_012752947.1 hypothetical protein SAMD00019534_070860 [Acytostelium subglobosum LB1]
MNFRRASTPVGPKKPLYEFVDAPPTPINVFTTKKQQTPTSATSSSSMSSTMGWSAGNSSTNSLNSSSLPKTPITSATPLRIPKSVTMSAIKPRVHTYPSSPAPGSDDGGLSASSSGGGDNINNLSTSSSFYFGMDDDDTSFMGSPESVFMADSARSTPAKLRTKTTTQRIKDMLSYPIDKWDELHEDLLVLNNHPLYTLAVYALCAFLNILLFGYAIDLFGNFIGLLILLISAGNTLYYVNSTKKVHLYRYQGTKFASPNMCLESIETPTGSIDNVMVLKIWDPKFTSKMVFTFFSPLHVFLMMMAGSDLDRFVNCVFLSAMIAYGIYFLTNLHDAKTRDEKILYTQLCEDMLLVFKDMMMKFKQSTDLSLSQDG